MAVDIIYLDNGRGVIIRACDNINGNDLISAYEKVYKQHQLIPQKYHIMDNSWCTEYDVTAKHLEAISDFDYKTAQINPDIVKAVIESSMLEFSLTELWQAHVDGFIHHSRSFSNQTNALVWIKEILYDNTAMVSS